MFLYPLILHIFFLLVPSGYGTNTIEREQDRLEKNLKVLRNDFNKLIENVEDFADHFLMQIHEAGNAVGTAYLADQDYNWQDDTSNVLKQPTHQTDENGSTRTSQSSHKNQQSSNEIRKREKRSTRPKLHFESVPPPPLIVAQPMPMDVNQQLTTPPENILGQSQLPNNKQSEVCMSITQSEIEKEKLEKLKIEVTKLNELVALLKDQQKVIKAMEENETNPNEEQKEKALEKSFLYKAIKKFEKNRTEEQGSPVQEINKIKSDLNKTKEMLIEEKGKEKTLESELKRQNTELKFIKVMMEKLYDNTNTPQLHKDLGGSFNDLGPKTSDNGDIVGAVLSSKPWLTKRRDCEISPVQRFLESLKPHQEVSSDPNFTSAESRKANVSRAFEASDELKKYIASTENADSSFEDKLDSFFKEVHKKFESKENPFKAYNAEFERQFFANQTNNALIQLTKHIMDQYRKSDFDTRQSSPVEDRDGKIHTLISILNKQEKKEDKSALASPNQRGFPRQLNSEKPDGARARASKSDELGFKLKLLDMITNEGRSDDVSDKEARLIKKLLLPEKKSDDEATLEALSLLLKSTQKPQDPLSSLIQSLNGKAQGKEFEPAVESELKQLQSAINNLRPKENNGFQSLGVESNRGRDEAQNFQSMLSQIIAQNGAGASANSFAGLATSSASSGSAAPQQYVNLQGNGDSTQLSLQGLLQGYGSSKSGYPGDYEANSGSNAFSGPQTYSSSFSSPYSSYGLPPNPYSSGLKNYNYNPYNSPPNPYSSNLYASNSEGGYNLLQNQAYNYGRPLSFAGGNKYQYPSSNIYGNYVPSNLYSPSSYTPSKPNYQTPSHYSPTYPISYGKSPAGYNNNNNNNNNNYYGGGSTRGNPFFQGGGNYQGHNYGPKSYSGPGLEQPYNNGQGPDQDKYNMIADLTQQIQNLENIISGLHKGGSYYQTSDDKAAIASLEQRIYELKGVISSLNQTPYDSSKQQYQGNSQSYGAAPQSYNIGTQNYAPPSQLQYQTDSQGSYSQSQSSYSPSSPPPPSNYNANPSSKPAPQASYPSTPPEVAPPATTAYQGKESVKEIDNDKQRRKRRQTGIREVPPVMLMQSKEVPDISIAMKQANNGGQNSDSELASEDALVQIANTFKKYLEENLSQSPASYGSESQQNRNSALDGLQQKLDNLKLQLDSQKSSARSFSDLLTPSINFPSAPTTYGTFGVQNNYLPQPYSNSKGLQLDTFVTTKKDDIFSEILIKILEKVIRSLPQVLSRSFGNVVTSIGDSEGDYYSSLQNVLKNLGPIGSLPLVLIKVLETAGTIMKHLKKNKFFKQFLLPGIVLALVGGSILFLIYFFQQDDDPYGYIDYQNTNAYPHYQAGAYENHYGPGTSPSYGHYEHNNYYRSNMDGNSVNNGFGGPQRFFNKNIGNNGNVPMEYSRGYYDYFEHNIENRFTQNRNMYV